MSSTALSKSIQNWVALKSGLPVIWKNQNGTRPAPPYIQLEASERKDGLPIKLKKGAAVPAPGTEIEIFLHQKKRLTIRITCFGGDASGDVSPLSTLSNLQDIVALPSNKIAFCDMGWTPIEFEEILDLSGELSAARIEPRAVTSWAGGYYQETSEEGTYVGTVNIEDELNGTTTTVTID